MPPSDKAAYLAAHYLSASKPPKPSSSSTKKRKRKQPASSSAAGLLITDDDETGWGGGSAPHNPDDDDAADAPVTVVAGQTTDFRRAKKSTWKTISSNPTTTTTQATSDATAEADAIIAAAAADSLALGTDPSDDPHPALPPSPSASQQPLTMMSNGALAGLQSASALTAQLRARQRLEAAELAALQASSTPTDAAATEPTVIMRDATGRRVDASLLRAAARQQAADAERAAHAQQSLLRGDVQKAAARARREALEDAAVMPLARGKDDAEMNEGMKREGRWNDPMAEFLSATNTAATGAGGGGGKKGKKGLGGATRPVYKGAAAPNRYGIRPGYRWDGVDRGNGFEAERFKALNRRERDKGLEYAWQMDE